MKKIEYGEFLRLRLGKIVKYGEKKDTRVENNRYIDYSGEYEWETCIVKHSFNIIDLIEVGDYVNGKLVKHIADFEGVKEPIRKLIFVDEHRLVPGETAENDEIKSILTKEQFKDAEYRLEEVKDE